MTEITRTADNDRIAENGHPDQVPTAEELAAGTHAFSELLFFAYRDFVGEPDGILQDYGFGRAHHRVLHFVNRHPGLRVADLLEILQITKQSLARVLKQLVDSGFIEQQTGTSDKRERKLYTTLAGQELAQALAAPQLERFERAFAEVEREYGTAQVREVIEAFLLAMVDSSERRKVAELIATIDVHGLSRENEAEVLETASSTGRRMPA